MFVLRAISQIPIQNMTCICQKIFCVIFGIHYIHTIKGIGKGGYCTVENVTVRTTNGTDTSYKKYCCAHYEQQNNECKECKVGYTSKNGIPCHQCEAGMYGKKCAFICKCEGSQSCHHVRGCISELGVTRIPSSVYTITEDDQLNSDKVFTKQQLLLCILSAACFVLLIGVFVLSWKYKKKSQSGRVTLSTTNHDEKDKKDLDLNLVNHSAVMFESVYDEIDESCIINSSSTLQKSKPSTNTNLLDESLLLNQRNSTEQHSVSSEYLTPISGNDENEDHSENPDTAIIIVVETPECCGRPDSAKSDYLIPDNAYQDSCVTSRVSDLNSQGDDYLQPYTSVISILQRETITVDIHTENQISSESDEEANDHKYSHLYEQLSHNWKHNCPTYTHPICSPQHIITHGTVENVGIQNTKVSNTFQNDETEYKGASGFNEMKMSSPKVPLSALESNITKKCLPFDNN